MMLQGLSTPAKPGKVEEIDYLRGFGVLAVIIIHTTGYFTEIPEVNLLTLVNLWTDVFVQFAVPLFILISGFVLAKNYSGDFSLKRFYFNRIRSIIPQYFIASVLYTALNNWEVITSNSLRDNSFLLLRNLWRAEASYHLWFFAIIIQLYIAFPVIIRVCRFAKKKKCFEGLLAFLLIAQTSFMIGTHTAYMSDIKLNFIGFLFYFSLGIYMADHFSQLTEGIKGKTSLLFVMSLFLAVGSGLFIVIGLTTGYRFSAIPGYFLIGSELVYPVLRIITFMFLLNVARSLKDKKKTSLAKVVKQIGKDSFGIYLIHIVFNQATIRYLGNHGIGFSDWQFYPIVLIVTVILSYISVRIISLLPGSYYLIGTKTKRRSSS